MKNILYFMSSLTMEEVFIVTGISLVLFAVACAILCSTFIKDPTAGYGPVEDDEGEED